ncbi:hypothetical protein AA313_de0210374 [Arthrobotrys entomopaga]|nr:hypothetical protein AA313_de0210374 [Arthrobotrys entomopaga]
MHFASLLPILYLASSVASLASPKAEGATDAGNLATRKESKREDESWGYFPNIEKLKDNWKDPDAAKFGQEWVPSAPAQGIEQNNPDNTKPNPPYESLTVDDAKLNSLKNAFPVQKRREGFTKILRRSLSASKTLAGALIKRELEAKEKKTLLRREYYIYPGIDKVFRLLGIPPSLDDIEHRMIIQLFGLKTEYRRDLTDVPAKPEGLFSRSVKAFLNLKSSLPRLYVIPSDDYVARNIIAQLFGLTIQNAKRSTEDDDLVRMRLLSGENLELQEKSESPPPEKITKRFVVSEEEARWASERNAEIQEESLAPAGGLAKRIIGSPWLKDLAMRLKHPSKHNFEKRHFDVLSKQLLENTSSDDAVEFKLRGTRWFSGCGSMTEDNSLHQRFDWTSWAKILKNLFHAKSLSIFRIGINKREADAEPSPSLWKRILTASKFPWFRIGIPLKVPSKKGFQPLKRDVAGSTHLKRQENPADDATAILTKILWTLTHGGGWTNKKPGTPVELNTESNTPNEQGTGTNEYLSPQETAGPPSYRARGINRRRGSTEATSPTDREISRDLELAYGKRGRPSIVLKSLLNAPKTHVPATKRQSKRKTILPRWEFPAAWRHLGQQIGEQSLDMRLGSRVHYPERKRDDTAQSWHTYAPDWQGLNYNKLRPANEYPTYPEDGDSAGSPSGGGGDTVSNKMKREERYSNP